MPSFVYKADDQLDVPTCVFSPIYQLSWWRLRSLADSKKSHENKEMLTFPGDRNHGIVAGLMPYSEYSLIVMTFNGRGNGPGSHAVNFRTPEGGEQLQKNSGYILITARWGREQSHVLGN